MGNLSAQIICNTVTTEMTAVDQSGIAVGNATSFEVSGNRLFVTENTFQNQTGISVSPGPAGAEGTVDHNLVDMYPGLESTAISLLNLENADFMVDVIANRVNGPGYDDGIAVAQQGSGMTTTRILDNLVTGEVAGAGLGCGIAVIGFSGSLEARIVNNTLPYDETGIGASTEAGVSATLVIANNVIASNSAVGLFLSEVDPATTVTQHHNLFFANATDIAANPSVSPGPGSIMADPLFVGAGDYELKPDSPAIDAGDDSAVPTTDLEGNPITDLDGNPRIQGSHVDIGAYETAPEAAATLSAAASLSALAALGLGRRRQLTASS
ncbi:MAG TPA: choice-of-anchor Q domain-containing protein [Solirubrobacteraceae bacterium]|nr:choice-of-anchor Q domain-containing protein [Solirubrobacteraceae bacterium]